MVILMSLAVGILSFFIILILHIIIWRIKKPEKEIMFLLLFFIILPFLFFIFILLINSFKDFTSNNFIFSVFLLYFSLSCAYIQTYPAARANAPSLQIVYFIYKSGKKGLSEKEIIQNFNLGNLVYERIEDLIKESFVYEEDKKLFLTQRGKIFIGMFEIYRKLYGLEFGQG